ncbi:MAG: DUF4389 domain-containing protein [Flavobacteriales bacterium]|jgi:hypothetical protein|nr:DUF4389 domain-containing protein [Flavobacteriales bacterium]NCG29403.1 DUF4389 domain-containing protein [Bacteroidota bacterium]MBT3963303.1 DUF4389 domain-containing protein [Flavobacteriales bacterium]MBT4705523.1 DUF4389 domain-containing protein [Flavobacteriales bacterium]MBT4930816.1 DUF4389 domain-containing protein [Flavobacteriales bacterium]
MMTYEIKRQETYSRGELLLRSFFGLFYIVLPHIFLLLFVGIAAGVLQFLAFWVILFTGRYPQSWFEFQVKYMRWGVRLSARIMNLSDGYPAFGLNATDEHTTFDVEYPETLSRSSILLRGLFGWIYVLIPHGIVLGLLGYAVAIVQFIAWWAVLFTGRYPESMFNFSMMYLRWSQRVSLYMAYMTPTYPPFSGAPDEGLATNPTPTPAPEPDPAADPEPTPEPDPGPDSTEESSGTSEGFPDEEKRD